MPPFQSIHFSCWAECWFPIFFSGSSIGIKEDLTYYSSTSIDTSGAFWFDDGNISGWLGPFDSRVPVCIIRLTPVYGLILGFLATLSVYVAQGPFWAAATQNENTCRSIGWRNFLYINNFFDESVSFYVLHYFCLISLWWTLDLFISAWEKRGTWRATCNSSSSVRSSFIRCGDGEILVRVSQLEPLRLLW